MTQGSLPTLDASQTVLIRKLQGLGWLHEKEVSALSQAFSPTAISLTRGAAVDYNRATARLVIESGFAGVVQCFQDQRPQIVRLLIPGDLVPVDFSDGVVEALTDCTLREIQISRLGQLEAERPSIAVAIDRDRALGQARFIRWVAFLAAAHAEARWAYFIAECHLRLAEANLTQGLKFGLPLTQEMIAQILGLSLVHTNKSLQSLRARGIVKTQAPSVEILDPRALLSVAGYDPVQCTKVFQRI